MLRNTLVWSFCDVFVAWYYTPESDGEEERLQPREIEGELFPDNFKCCWIYLLVAQSRGPGDSFSCFCLVRRIGMETRITIQGGKSWEGERFKPLRKRCYIYNEKNIWQSIAIELVKILNETSVKRSRHPILCNSVFAAGLQSIVMGTGLSVSCVVPHQPSLILSPCLTLSHTSAVASTRETPGHRILWNMWWPSVQYSAAAPCWCRLVEGGGKNWRGHSKHYTALHNITQHYTALHNIWEKFTKFK